MNLSGLIAILTFSTVLLLFEGVRRLNRPGVGAFLPEIILNQRREKPKRKSKTFLERRILPVAPSLAERFTFLRAFSEPEKVVNILEYAGKPYGMDVEQYFGFQIYLMLVGLVLGVTYAMLGVLIGGCGGPFALILLPVGGFFYPRLWLNRKAKQRQEAINLGMPDFIDMLVISVQAGMGFDNAMQLVTRHVGGPLNDEMRRFLRELDVGEPRAVAFDRMIKRNTSEDLRIFVDAILQAEELGTPIARTLELQASELRQRRINRAREKAAQASPNISLITVFLIVPAVLCLFLSMMAFAIFFGENIGIVLG